MLSFLEAIKVFLDLIIGTNERPIVMGPIGYQICFAIHDLVYFNPNKFRSTFRHYSFQVRILELYSKLKNLILSHCFFSELRSSCNILIACDSVCALVFILSDLLSYVNTILSVESSFITCFLIFLPSVWVVEISSWLVLAIALDRLIHVLFPIW